TRSSLQGCSAKAWPSVQHRHACHRPTRETGDSKRSQRGETRPSLLCEEVAPDLRRTSTTQTRRQVLTPRLNAGVLPGCASQIPLPRERTPPCTSSFWGDDGSRTPALGMQPPAIARSNLSRSREKPTDVISGLRGEAM